MTQERLEKLKAIKEESKAKTKGKSWQVLTAKDKDEKLKSLCLLLGLYEDPMEGK